MIWLQSDCLLVKTASGETIPCSAEAVAVELVGEAASAIDPVVMQNAAHAVLQYFKNELGRDMVTVGEFSEALARILRDFGLQVELGDPPQPVPRVAESDLRQLVAESGLGFELGFFHRLRDEMRRHSGESPEVVRFTGLRDCVRSLSGARRWTRRCQALHDQIVDYLRRCWNQEPRRDGQSLVVN